MIIVSYSEDADFRAKLDQELASFNDQQSPWHRDIRATGGQPFDLKVDQDDEIIAGLYGEMYWESFEIDRLWVSSDYRNQGIARALLCKAEAIAREKSCRFLHLSTFSFQAPDLYQKLGFKCVGKMEDFPPGFAKYWFRKTL
jgi:ribosomal protein S18 acetylase RimI-like enzyme